MEFKKYTPPESKKAELLSRITDEDYAQSLIATGDGVKRGTLFRYLLTAAAMLVVAVGITAAALVGREIFHGKKPVAPPPAATEYTVVYNPDGGNRIIATNESDTVDESRSVTELDLAATLRYTGLVRDEDNKAMTELTSWYAGKIKPHDQISYEPLTFSKALNITWIYARVHMYDVTYKEVAKVFDGYGETTLTHRDLRQIVCDLTALFKKSGFKFNIGGDTSRIEITPAKELFRDKNGSLSLEEGGESYEEFLKHCITLTKKGDIDKLVRFLDTVVITDAFYSDETLTGSFDYMKVYDACGVETHDFIIGKNSVRTNNCTYLFEKDSFAELIDMIHPPAPDCTVRICCNLFDFIIENKFSTEVEFDWYRDRTDDKLDRDRLADITSCFYSVLGLKDTGVDLPKKYDNDSVRDYVFEIRDNLYIDLPDSGFAIVNGEEIAGDDLTRLINYIENTRIEKLSVRPVATGGTNDAIAFFTDGGEPVTFDYTRSALMSNSITYTLPTDCLAKVYDHNRDFSGDVYLDIDGKKVTLSKEDAQTVRDIVSGGSWYYDMAKTHYPTKLVIGDKRLGYELGLRLLPCGRGSIELNFAASQRLLAVLENYIN